jgi:hypothetical protein
MSLSTSGYSYSVGLIKPMEPLPANMRAELIRVRMEPVTGDDAPMEGVLVYENGGVMEWANERMSRA